MKKECQFILLPTTNSIPSHGDIGIIDYKLVIVDTADAGFLHNKFKPQHLYILSNDEIKEGNWYVDLYKNIYQRNGLVSDKCKKIIATTNGELWSETKLDGKMSVPTGIGMISQSDIDHIINLYNGKDKEVDVEKYLIKKAQQYAIDSHSPNRAARSAGYVDGYNQCLQDNVNKKFTLEDIENAYDAGSNFALKKKDDCFTDKFEEEKQKYIQYFTKEQSNNTVVVEYECDELPSKRIKIGDVDLTEFNDNPYKPKFKDGYIMIHQT